MILDPLLPHPSGGSLPWGVNRFIFRPVRCALQCFWVPVTVGHIVNYG